MINIHNKFLLYQAKNKKLKLKKSPTNINAIPIHNFPYNLNELSNLNNSNHIRNINYKNFNNINKISNIQNYQQKKIRIQLKNTKSTPINNIKKNKNFRKDDIIYLKYPPLISTRADKEIFFNKIKLGKNDIIKHYMKLKKSNSVDSSLKYYSIIKSDKLPLISCCNNYNKNQILRKKVKRCVSSYDINTKKVNDLYLSLGYFPKINKPKIESFRKKLILKKNNTKNKIEYKSKFHLKKINFLLNKSLKDININEDEHLFFHNKFKRIKSTNKYPLIKIKSNIYNVHSIPNLPVNNINKDDELLNDKGTYGESFF